MTKIQAKNKLAFIVVIWLRLCTTEGAETQERRLLLILPCISKSLAVILCLLICYCTNNSSITELKCKDIEGHQYSVVSFDNISSKNYDYVELVGYFTYEFENVGIYPDKRGVISTGFWVECSKNLQNKKVNLSFFHNKKVVIRGRLNKKSKGHLNQYLGELYDVCYIKRI